MLNSAALQTPKDDLIPVLITGTSIVVTLIVFLFLFVIIYQRKMIMNQLVLRQLHDEKQNDLLAAVFETQENERKRLAEDLHDSVGQVLSAIRLNLHRLDRNGVNETTKPLLSDTRKLTDECLQEIRNIIHNVLPPVLTDYGLIEALEGLCKRVEQNTKIAVDLTKRVDTVRFKPEIELAFYRIAQELFSNAIKHAGADIIHLKISTEGDWLTMEFKDNGHGFDMEAVKKGFGLKNLQSRIQLINGEINTYTKPQNGTITIIRVMIG
jgi:signal transduction histidine kinase